MLKKTKEWFRKKFCLTEKELIDEQYESLSEEFKDLKLLSDIEKYIIDYQMRIESSNRFLGNRQILLVMAFTFLATFISKGIEHQTIIFSYQLITALIMIFGGLLIYTSSRDKKDIEYFTTRIKYLEFKRDRLLREENNKQIRRRRR